LTALSGRANRGSSASACVKSHSNPELTVVSVFQAGFAKENRYVDVDQVRCILGPYRSYHCADGLAIFDDSVGRPPQISKSRVMR
jgi:hypothetical protein